MPDITILPLQVEIFDFLKIIKSQSEFVEVKTIDIVTHYDKLIDDNNDPFQIILKFQQTSY